MNQKALLACGMLFPVVYIIMTILGGALRPGYSHISDTVSELLSPGAPNKPLLMVFQITHALLGVLFGIGVLQFVRGSENNRLTGIIGAGMIITVGVATVATAIFPQDPFGAPLTFPGKLHNILVFGVLVPLTILSTLLIGIWLKQADIFPWFRTYSFITIGASLLLAGLAGATLGTPIMGLTERLAVLAGFQWTFVLALKLFLL
jgi:hypothetical protein